MSIGIIVAEAIIFCMLFTVLVFATTGKNSTAQIHNYPPEIQEEYFKTHERIETEPLSIRVIIIKGFAIVLFSAILLAMAYIAKVHTFWQGFFVAFILMLVIGMYDTFFLDWVLFANMKRFRLPGTEHMDKEYHQKWFHLKGMLFPGIVFAFIPAGIVGAVIMLIF